MTCSSLGTTIKIAWSEAAFRRVDFDFVVNIARAARTAGATRLAVVSAVGADPTSRIFYNRVKGEMQVAVMQLGYESVVIAEPSLLLGDRAALGQVGRNEVRQVRCGAERAASGQGRELQVVALSCVQPRASNADSCKALQFPNR